MSDPFKINKRNIFCNIYIINALLLNAYMPIHLYSHIVYWSEAHSKHSSSSTVHQSYLWIPGIQIKTFLDAVLLLGSLDGVCDLVPNILMSPSVTLFRSSFLLQLLLLSDVVPPPTNAPFLVVWHPRRVFLYAFKASLHGCWCTSQLGIRSCSGVTGERSRRIPSLDPHSGFLLLLAALSVNNL